MQSFKGKMVSIQSWRKDKTENLLRKAEGMGSKSRLAGRLQAEGGIASFVSIRKRREWIHGFDTQWRFERAPIG